MARLHGFPDWFRFQETKWHGARQIGNAVPPPLARAIAAKIMEALRIKPARPEIVLRLGNPDLVRMDMSTASLLQVAVRIIRRFHGAGLQKQSKDALSQFRDFTSFR